jgi:hypothetical protein
MSEHPYRSQPKQAFWSRAVAPGFDARDGVVQGAPLIRRDDIVVSAGSCFASNLVPYLEEAGFTYLRTERVHPAFAHLPENLGYRSFSAAYGNIYTTRQLRQLLERALGRFHPLEDRWHVDGLVIDPFRPGLRYPAQSDAEFDALTAQHLRAALAAFQGATVIVFTLGLTEAWESSADGAVYPACPGTISGTFDPEKHRFHNFSVDEVRDDLTAFIHQVRAFNPEVRLILTVSPVPLVATATLEHVLVATSYSKAVLRVAANEVAAAEPGVVYFPAFEIVSGPQAPQTYYEEDRRNVSTEGVEAVMSALLTYCETEGVAGETGARAANDSSGGLAANGTPPARPIAQPALSLSEAVAQAECDEAMADVG